MKEQTYLSHPISDKRFAELIRVAVVFQRTMPTGRKEMWASYCRRRQKNTDIVVIAPLKIIGLERKTGYEIYVNQKECR